MASAAQIEANRKNAQNSTGPVTPEGEANSGRNSIRHGILSRIIPIDAPPETGQESLSTICPDIDARIAKLARIPYNEFAVQSRVTAYDAHRTRYGSQ